ncbi:uncharacterized protein with beta-barrel porin domain [Nitrospirillum amazonense]|uniref:Uncharacterized protein with beta-barrel porin domain n=1 Tax=Nitrospirillum amazonense TaxID=28077 RepID=A0A560JY85_9PROT|nr:autotransporter outer membrane beta-barrel domain-containing protein [Nitrospirillum amazonense]TWB73310.1 uncharacterized protein with beta-barrel porin domain [Nitrospirillum amazonense]
MRTATPTRSKALLLGASVLALATSWQHPARADINVTGNSGPVSITSGGLANSGTISGSYSAVVDASGSLSSIANSGALLVSGFSGTVLSLHGSTDGSTPAALGTLANNAGGIIQGGWMGVLLNNATINTVSNSGTIATSYAYYGNVIGAVASAVSGTVRNVVVDTLINNAGGTIAGYGGIDFTGSTINTLINSGIIANGGLNGSAINVGSFSSYVPTYNGSIFTYQTYASPGSISTFINTASGSIFGNVILSGSIATIDNAGLMQGTTTFYGTNALTALTTTIGAITNRAGGTISGFTDGLALSGSTIGALTNSGTISAASAFTSTYGAAAIDLRANEVYRNSAWTDVAGTLGTLVNTAGGQIIANGYAADGIALTGSTIGVIQNDGTIKAGTGINAASAYLGTTVFDSVTSSYVYTTQQFRSRLGTLTNSTSGVIQAQNNGVLLGGDSDLIDNAGLIIAGTVGSYYYGTGTGISGSAAAIGTLLNESTGTIYGGNNGILLNGGSIGTLINDGTILSGAGTALVYYGSGYTTLAHGMGTLINAAGATISGGAGGLSLSDTIGTLQNNGLIRGTTGAAINLGYTSGASSILAGSITSLTNSASGTIQGNSGLGLTGGIIGTLANAGTIAGSVSAIDLEIAGVSGCFGTYCGSLYLPSTIPTLTNAAGAVISGGYTGIAASGGTIGTLHNAGVIQGASYAGVALGRSNYYSYDSTYPEPSITAILNDGGATIRGGAEGVQVSRGTVTSLVNNGLISGMLAGISGVASYGYTNRPLIDTIVNTGTILATGTTTGGAALDFTDVNVGTIKNSGVISGYSALAVYGYTTGSVTTGALELLDNQAGGQLVGTGTIAAIDAEGTIHTITNAGLISAMAGTHASAINVDALVGTLTNATTGTITASGAAVGLYDTIGVLNNAGTLTGATAGINSHVYSYVSSYSSFTSSSSFKGSVGTLSNTGLIGGGATGVISSGSIGSLSNAGTIIGGTAVGIQNLGTAGQTTYTTTPWYAPVAVATTTRVTTTVGGAIGTLKNTGVISGGETGLINGLAAGPKTIITYTRDAFSASILSRSTVVSTTGPIGGTIGTLMNSGTILGTATAGIDNGAATAVIGTLVNGGLIQGGQTGIINAGTIGTLTNSGTITGAGAAIRDSGTLGPVTNTGVIAGAIIHTAATDLSITGGSGTVFGTLTGVSGARGTLSSTASNVTLAGNIVLNDSVSVAGHTLVENGGSLVLTAPTTLTGNYAQAGGTLTAVGTGGTVGGLQVSGSASISGATVVLTSQYAYGLTSGASYTIVAAGDAASSYTSVTALAPGYGSTTVTSTVVGGQTDLIISIGASSLAAGGTATIAGGAGVLDQMTGGTLAITGGTPTVGSIAGGTLTQTSGSASLGTVTGGTIALTGGSATLGTISGGTLTQSAGSTIAGTTAVQVQGGSLNLGGTVQAPLAVNGGLVALNGSASGPVTVGSGGTLRGSGVITGAATVAGVLRPGNSPGTLTFTNGLTQAAKSVLSIDIDGTGTGKGAGNYSRVLVTGGSYVIGSGAVLQPNLRGMTGSASNTYTPGLGTDFTIVQAAGGVSGTFAGITQPSSGLLAGTQFTALYGSNAIDLYVTPTYGSLASLGASANQQTMGRVVAGLTGAGNADLGTVLKALYGLPTVGASLDALAQIGGSSQANIVAYSLNRGLAATQVLGQRLAAVRDGVAGGMQGTMQAQLVGRTLYTSMASGDAPVIEDERGAAAGSAPEEGWHFWAQGLGAFTRVDSDGNAAGGHSNTGGGLFGGDRTVAPGVTLGLAGVLLQSTSGGSNETSSYGLSAYGNVDLGDGLFVTGNAGYTYDQYDTARTMGFGGLSRTAFGHTTGDELSAGVTAGYRVRVSNLTLEPQAGIQWLKVGRDGFTETGAGALNLVLQDLDATALQSSVGGRASASWKTDGGTVITPALRAAWLHDFRDRALTSQAALAGTTFAVTGPDTGANALGIGGGLTLQEGNNLNLYANYDGTLRRHETDHVFTAGFRLSW